MPRSCTRRRSFVVQDRRAGAGGLPRSRLRPSPGRVRPPPGAPRAVRGGLDQVHSVEEYLDWPVDRRLEQRIVDGNRTGLESDLDEALEGRLCTPGGHQQFLLAGMRTVGELFASGEMQLPFVLSSAETMKGAVDT